MDEQILDPNVRPEMSRQIIMPQPKKSNWKIITLAILAICVLAAAAWYFIFSKKSSLTNSSNVSIQVKGPDSVSSGSEAEYHILYHNGENGDLTNLTLNMIYPSNFSFKSATPAPTASAGITFNLPILKEGKDGEVVIRGKLSGSTGEDKQIQAKLHYKLSNFNSDFEVSTISHTNIKAPQLTLDITGPSEVPAGQDTTFTLNYTNVSGQDYDNAALSVVYPGGFKFTSSSVQAAKGNNYWSLGKLSQNTTGHIDVTGSFAGSNFDQQLVTGSIGLVINNNFASQISSTATFVLKGAPILLTQTADPADVVTLGSEIHYTIKFRNEGQIGLTNIVITDNIATNLIDTSRLSIPDALITGNTITWKAATNPDLSILTPGASGQVQFSLPLKSSLVVTSKNQVVLSSVSAISSEITTPIKASDLSVKLASKASLSVSATYASGSMPMTVGQTTVYNVRLVLVNGSNDLDNMEVDASMPLPSSSWKNIITPTTESAKISFDPNAGKIRWKVGSVPAFTGKLTPSAQVTFQIAVTPEPSDQSQTIRLLTNVQTSGADVFTGKDIILPPVAQFTTSDIDDVQVQNTGGTVQ